MGAYDPVAWEEIEVALGPPASEVEAAVEAMESRVRDRDPYDAVKTIHDALDEQLEESERTVPGFGEVFVTAYLLEQRGRIESGGARNDEYPSLLERRPSADRLEELFWDRRRTLWWIGIVAGVHPSLVSYWLYEDDIPLMERNLTEESMARVREYRAAGDG